MKKTLFSLTAGCLLLASSCTSHDYTVTVKLPEANAGELTAVMINFDNGDTIAVAQPVGDVITFAGKVEQPVMVRLLLPGSKTMFVLESGNIEVDMATRNVTGTELNDKLNALDSIQENIGSTTKELLSVDSISQDEKAAILANYEQNMTALYDSVYKSNIANPVGYYAFLELLYAAEGDGVDSLVDAAPANYKEYARVKKILKAAECSKATAEGQPFTDFTVLSEDGISTNFSDFVGKGTPYLVDFWASWCGPCRREIPNIKEIHEKYGDRLGILGIAVWDKPEDTAKAIESLEITWPVIINAQTVPTDIYGINGIPHIIIIDGDGTILSRGLQGEELAAKVDEIMAQ